MIPDSRPHTAPLPRRAFLQRLTLASGAAGLTGFAACSPTESRATAPQSAEFRLYHEVHGDGPPIVFAHGAGGTHLSWWNQVPAFAERYTCVVYDQRGYGYSPDVPNGPGRSAFVDDLRDLLDRLEIERAALVGQSMGGRSVLGFACAHPERVQALVMSSTTGGYTDPELDQVRAAAPDLGPRSAFSPEYAARDPAGAFLYRSISRTNQVLQPEEEGQENSAPAADRPDIQRLIDAGVPTLFIVGDQDTVAPPSVTTALQAKIPGSKLATVRSGHSPYWEIPDEFNQIVMSFLAV